MEVDLAYELADLSLSNPLEKAQKYLVEKLNQLPVSYRELCKNGGWMTGSFVVKAFFPNDPWEPDDIDVVTMNYDSILEVLNCSGWVRSSAPTVRPLYTHFKSVKYSHVDCKIQINMLFPTNEEENIENYIDSTFDFDGCTIKWNGDHFKLCPTLSITNFLQKKWSFRITSSTQPDLFRTTYQKSQFRTIQNYEDHVRFKIHEHDDIRQRICARIDKYTNSRGVEIVNLLAVIRSLLLAKKVI